MTPQKKRLQGKPDCEQDSNYYSKGEKNKKPCGLTVCVTGAGAGVDSAWEQKKLKARKMLENAAESPASSARFVGQF